MIDISKCQKIVINQGAFYLGPSTTEYSEGYLELNPYFSLTLHNRTTGIENLVQIEGKASMVVYDSPNGRLVTMNEGDKLKIDPAGTWHIHCNPYDKKCLQYWYFEGDITSIIEKIRKDNL